MRFRPLWMAGKALILNPALTSQPRPCDLPWNSASATMDNLPAVRHTDAFTVSNALHFFVYLETSKTSLKANSEATFFRKLSLEPLPYGKRVPSHPWWPGRALPLPCEDHFPLPPWRLTGLCIFWRKGMYSSFNSPVLCIVSAKEHALHKCLLNWWLDEYKGPKSRCLKDVKQNPVDGLNIHLLSGCFIISQELLLKKSAEVSAAAACALLGA